MPPPRYQMDGTLPGHGHSVGNGSAINPGKSLSDLHVTHPSHVDADEHSNSCYYSVAYTRTLPHPKHQLMQQIVPPRDDSMIGKHGYLPAPSPAPPLDGSYYNMNSDRYLSYPPMVSCNSRLGSVSCFYLSISLIFLLVSSLPSSAPPGLSNRLYADGAHIPSQPYGNVADEHELHHGSPAGCDAPHDTHTATNSGNAASDAAAEAAGHLEGSKQAGKHDKQCKFECTDPKCKEYDGQRKRFATGRGLVA